MRLEVEFRRAAQAWFTYSDGNGVGDARERGLWHDLDALRRALLPDGGAEDDAGREAAGKES